MSTVISEIPSGLAQLKLDRYPVVAHVRRLPIELLRGNEAQPTTRKASKQLIENIRRNGVIFPIHAYLSSRGYLVIVDGHRRVDACTQLGIEDIPVVVCHRDTRMAEANAGATPFAGKNWLTLWAKSSRPTEDLSSMTKTQRDYITRLIAIVNEPTLRKLGQWEVVAPAVIQIVNTFHQRLRDLNIEYDKRSSALFVMLNPVQDRVRRGTAKQIRRLALQMDKWIEDNRIEWRF